jgi:hypothetical protein
MTMAQCSARLYVAVAIGLLACACACGHAKKQTVCAVEPTTLVHTDRASAPSPSRQVRPVSNPQPRGDIRAASWFGLYQALDGEELGAVETEEDARRDLCVGDCTGAGPWLLRSEWSIGVSYYVAGRDDQGLFATLAFVLDNECEYPDVDAMLHASDDFVMVVVRFEQTHRVFYSDLSDEELAGMALTREDVESDGPEDWYCLSETKCFVGVHDADTLATDESSRPWEGHDCDVELWEALGSLQ